MLIVVGYAPRPESRAALEYAVQEALEHGARLHLVRTVGLPGDTQGGVSGWADGIAAAAGSHDAIVAELTGRGLEVTSQVEAAEADAADALLRAAREHAADLIVIGLRRRSRVGKLVLGSVAQDVLLGADCPVVAVKAPDPEA